MYKLTFTLKQHTPLIHFQPDQQGATLRASEVKPKLDRFIIEKLGENSYEHGIELAREKGWILKKNDHTSLDYKLKIVGNGNVSKSEEPPSPFFGNIKVEEANKKKLSFYKTVNLYFTSENPILCFRKFEEYLAEFINKNNFGSRSNKGFGSFTLVTDNVELNEVLKNINPANFYDYYFEIKSTNYKDVFFHIDLLSKIVRSGYNINGLYIKALSYFYSKDKVWQWDKRSIKERFPATTRSNRTLTNAFNFSSNNLIKGNKPFVRGILGLSTNQSWGRDTLHIVDEEQKYERYASPIHYKPVLTIDNSTIVYFDWSDKKNGIWGKTFQHFFNDNQIDNLSLTVPTKNDFEPDKFMKFISKAQPRQFLNFRLDLRSIENKLRTDERLDVVDKQILTDWRRTKAGDCLIMPNLPINKLGLDDFSLFDFIENTEFRATKFSNKETIKVFIDSFIPKRQLKAIDTIFNQLNTRN